MKSFKFYITFLLFFILSSCTQDNENFIVNKKEYKNKLEGFWLGQSIANWTGIITEMDKIGNIIQSQSSSTIQDSYDLKLDGVGYTIGKVLEYIIHEKYYGGASILSYIGFRKNHPHDSHSIIRIAFKDDESINASTQLISQIFVEACQEGIKIYNSIASEF